MFMIIREKFSWCCIALIINLVIIVSRVDTAFAADCPPGQLFVDFESGSDLNNGGSVSTAWKQSPGDLNAVGAAACTPIPGNTINLKGGVKYRGIISINRSGLAGQEITLRTGPGWGLGNAVIDGSIPLTGWMPCVSQNECLNNSSWSGMFYKDMNLPTHLALPTGLLLFQGDLKLRLAQYPMSTQTWYQNTTDFYSPTAITKTTLTDPRLANFGGAQLVGKYLWVWCCGNELALAKVLSYDSATSSVSFASLEPYVYDAVSTKYAIVNAPSSNVFKEPGSYYYDEATHRLYLLPFSGEHIASTNSVNMSVLMGGVSIPNNINYVAVSGLTIQRQSGDSYGEGGSIGFGNGSNLIAKNNILRYSSGYSYYTLTVSGTKNAIIEGNHLYDIGGSMQGILYTGANSIIKDNTLERLSRTNIYVAGGNTVSILGNTIKDSAGVHGHSFAVYQGAHDVLMADNVMTNIASGATQDCSRLTMVNNIIENGITWDNICNDTVVVNNIIGTIGTGYGPLGNPPPTYIAKNNIGINGLSGASNINTVALDNSTKFVNAPRIFFSSILDIGKMTDVTDIGELYIEGYTEYSTMVKPGDILTFSFDRSQRTVTGITNMIYSGNRRNKLAFTPSVSLLKEGTVTVWPVGTTNFSIDYTPKQGGGFIDSGENAMSVLPVLTWSNYLFGRDLFGTLRPQGNGWDIGVYEYPVSGGSSKPLAPTGLRAN
jgi:hypothetical protein